MSAGDVRINIHEDRSISLMKSCLNCDFLMPIMDDGQLCSFKCLSEINACAREQGIKKNPFDTDLEATHSTKD